MGLEKFFLPATIFFILSVLQRISVSFKILCIQMLFSVLYYIKSGTWEQGFPAVFLHFISPVFFRGPRACG